MMIMMMGALKLHTTAPIYTKKKTTYYFFLQSSLCDDATFISYMRRKKRNWEGGNSF